MKSRAPQFARKGKILPFNPIFLALDIRAEFRSISVQEDWNTSPPMALIISPFRPKCYARRGASQILRGQRDSSCCGSCIQGLPARPK